MASTKLTKLFDLNINAGLCVEMDGTVRVIGTVNTSPTNVAMEGTFKLNELSDFG
jgi:hypothetical protein